MFTALCMAILVVLGVMVVTAVFQLLWNMTMPQVFGLKAITFWQAFRLILISGILFGSGAWVRFHG